MNIHRFSWIKRIVEESCHGVTNSFKLIIGKHLLIHNHITTTEHATTTMDSILHVYQINNDSVNK